jgi:hypothetical protein
MSRYEGLRAALRAAAVQAAGRLSPRQRAEIVDGATLEGPLGAYVQAVRERADRVTAEDIAALTAAGLRQDEIFEATVGAAVGAALSRYERARRAVEAADAAR